MVVGEEVSTREGELIGLFLERPVPRDRSAEETIAVIHQKGGLVSVPHRFSHNRSSHLRHETLDRLWPQLDALRAGTVHRPPAGWRPSWLPRWGGRPPKPKR